VQVTAFQDGVKQHSGGKFRVVQLPVGSTNNVEGLSPEIVAKHGESIAVTLDKLVCARSEVFLGSVLSTFSADIQRLRFGLGTASCADSTLCRGQLAWRGKANRPSSPG
jgi:hypothetical protein